MANTLKFGNGEWYGKKDTILAYNDENSNYKPLPFDFSRASNATVINKDGLIEEVASGQPRIDYKDDSKGALLLEPSRSNILPYSEDFENSDWTKNAGTTITNNYAISPDGSLNASRYLGTGTSGLGDKFTLSATSYTISFWVKSNTSQNQYCRLIGDSSNVSENLLITTKWTRLSYTFTGSGLSNKTNGIFRDSSDNNIDILIYGAQLEQGSYATSYIPTSGSAVTRVADVCNNGGNEQVFNDNEGVLYADIANIADDGINKRITINDGTTNNRLILQYRSTSNEIAYYFVVGGVNQCAMIYTLSDASQFNKIALKYKTNDFALWVDGTEVMTDTFGNTMSVGTLSNFDFDGGTNNLPFYGNVKDLRVYNTALTDAELQALTQ